MCVGLLKIKRTKMFRVHSVESKA